jgi:hypothetical protein
MRFVIRFLAYELLKTLRDLWLPPRPRGRR